MQLKTLVAITALVLAGFGLITIASNGRATPPGANAGGQFFLPTGVPRNVGTPRIAADRSGALHLVYPAFTRGDAFYAYCPGACRGPADARAVRLPTAGTVVNAMVAVTPEGHPRLLLSTFQRLYYAACDGDCTTEAGWTMTTVLDHHGKLEVSGAAFAITADGRPRVLLHSFRNLGLPGADAGTWYMQCDARCTDQAGWRVGQISRQVWEEPSLKLDAGGRPRLVKAERVGANDYMAAFASCDDGCGTAGNWRQVPLAPVHNYLPDTVPMRPAMALALTRGGLPRVAMIAKLNGAKALLYTECDADCLDRAYWQAQVLVGGGKQGDTIKAGVDIAVDAQDRPRLVYTANWSVLLAACNGGCANEAEPSWSLTKVEGSGDMAPDRVIPYSNCDVSAWFVHSPALVIGAGGVVRTAYRAQDISGGWRHKAQPHTTPCSAGPDMTFARLARTIPATR